MADVFVMRAATRVVQMFPGVARRTLTVGERLMLVESVMEAGASMPLHHHPHEQLSYVVEGAYEVTIGSEKVVCRKGDSYRVAPNVPHAQRALERTVAVDAFSPPREEYMDSPAADTAG